MWMGGTGDPRASGTAMRVTDCCPRSAHHKMVLPSSPTMNSIWYEQAQVQICNILIYNVVICRSDLLSTSNTYTNNLKKHKVIEVYLNKIQIPSKKNTVNY